MGSHRSKVFSKLVTILTAVFAVITFLGQGCGTSSFNEVENKLGIQKAFGNGNGGGYGGMLPGNGGGYGGVTPPADPAEPRDGGLSSTTGGEYGGSAVPRSHGPERESAVEAISNVGWYRFGPKRTDDGCKKYPNRLKQVGPYIYGLITYANRKARYQTSACDQPEQIPNASVMILPFDPIAAIHNDDIHIRLNSPQPRVADISIPTAYCLNAQIDGGRKVGISVLVYKRGDKMFATIAQGKRLDTHYVSFRVRPFQVQETRSATQVHIATGAFDLQILRNSEKESEGQLDVLLDGEQRQVPMTCYLNEP